MIKFDPSKEKNLKFNIEVQGIDPSLLEYNIRLSNNKIDYGFKGINENGTIKFAIPPLNEIVKEDILESIDKIKMEVNDKNNKYYLKPFEDSIKIQNNLKVEAQLSEEETKDKEDIPIVEANLSEEEETKIEKEQVIEQRPSKKSSKFKKFLGE